MACGCASAVMLIFDSRKTIVCGVVMWWMHVERRY